MTSSRNSILPPIANQKRKLNYLLRKIKRTKSPSLNGIDFTENDLILAIKELQTNSSAGPDGVPAVLLKKVGRNLSKPLSVIWK